MAETWRIRLEKEQHTFAAAHFITFNRDICERLHGHNYRVAVEIEGPLDENQYVVDFIAVRDSLSEIVSGLDHRMLLPAKHPLIRVVSDESETIATFTPDGRRWVFPREDCVILPMENTTAELLARWIGGELTARLGLKGPFHPSRVSVFVDENHGQWGEWELTK